LLQNNRPRGSHNRIIVPQQDWFKRLFSELIQGKPDPADSLELFAKCPLTRRDDVI
jgi:hypothetical protein